MTEQLQRPEWGPRVEYAVRYISRTAEPGKSPVKFMIVGDKSIAQRAVDNRVPGSGEHHTIVRRTVSDWEEE